MSCPDTRDECWRRASKFVCHWTRASKQTWEIGTPNDGFAQAVDDDKNDYTQATPNGRCAFWRYKSRCGACRVYTPKASRRGLKKIAQTIHPCNNLFHAKRKVTRRSARQGCPHCKPSTRSLRNTHWLHGWVDRIPAILSTTYFRD